MEIKVFPSNTNHLPKRAFSIRGNNAMTWLVELQKLSLNLTQVKCFPLPDLSPNSIWGCLVILKTDIAPTITKHQWYQCFEDRFFIPEYADFLPRINREDLNHILQTEYCVYHPEFGFVELKEEFNPKNLIKLPQEKSCYVFVPAPSSFIPTTVKRMSIVALDEEDTISNLEEKFPKKEPMPHAPLDVWEKIKLFGYKKLLGAKGSAPSKINVSENPSYFSAMWQKMFPKNPQFLENMLTDFQDLEERNMKQVDKLLDMLKNDPDQALKYAIPIDNEGVSRGVQKGQYKLGILWNSYALFGSRNNSGRGITIDLGDGVSKLQAQYYNTATELIKNGQYEKAAFVYLKLLNNHHLAASTLEDGGFYSEAAALYLKYSKNKLKAAECYEKGSYSEKAIELYKELGENLKVGDLYYLDRKIAEGNVYYEKEVEERKRKGKFLKAAEIYLDRMDSKDEAQKTLLQGWYERKESVNCLNEYFSNIDDQKKYIKKLESIHNDLTDSDFKISFLKVMTRQYRSNEQHQERIKSIAYQVISEVGKESPEVVKELKYFNKGNDDISTDITRFRIR
jgi:hypothetical protein